MNNRNGCAAGAVNGAILSVPLWCLIYIFIRWLINA